MRTNGLPDFSTFSTTPFTPKQIRQSNYFYAVLLILGVCCLAYWYDLTNGDLLRKFDSGSESLIKELLVTIGAIQLLLHGISGLVSFQMIKQMSPRKRMYVMSISMIVTNAILFFVVIQKVQ